MSMTEPVGTVTEPWDDLAASPSVVRSLPAATTIVPKDSIAGRSLTVIVAIMTFLASLTTGVAMLVVSAASDWRSDVGREVTIQVRPAPGRNIDADVRAAVELARAAPGIADVRAYTKDEIRPPGRTLARRRTCARRPADSAPDRRQARVRHTAGFRTVAPGAGGARSHLEPRRSPPLGRTHAHHGGDSGGNRCRGARPDPGGDGASVTFATRGTMATNRPIVEVLHYVGATDSFVSGQFLRHFLLLGFKGGAIGYDFAAGPYKLAAFAHCPSGPIRFR